MAAMFGGTAAKCVLWRGMYLMIIVLIDAINQSVKVIVQPKLCTDEAKTRT